LEAKVSYEFDTRKAVERLGVDPNGTLPLEGVPETDYCLVSRRHGALTLRIWIAPKIKPGRAHRFLARCPKCPAVVSFGRIWQHMVVHKEKAE
jgi:hypothetical protein